MDGPLRIILVLQLLLLTGVGCGSWEDEGGGESVEDRLSGRRHVIVHIEPALSIALNDHAEPTFGAGLQGRLQPGPRERTPMVYFYSRGAQEVKNRGSEVFHQLHDAVRREGVISFLEDGVEEYKTELSQYVDEADEVFSSIGRHDVVVVTAIPHSMDGRLGFLLPDYTGAPHLAKQGLRVVKWQIGYSFPSISYFVDEHQHMICDTHFLKNVMGCVKEAVIRAPPLPLYYQAAEEALREVGGGSLSPLKERLVLFDNDHALDTSQLRLREGCALMKLDGMSRAQMIDAYRRAVAVIDLWLPGAETVTAEGAMFDCCVLVSNEMNGADPTDFPVAEEFKINRDPAGNWNYTQLSELLNRALDDYDDFVQHFKPLKDHVMALPSLFQSSVHRYFSNDVHFIGGAFTHAEQELALPWVLSVLMNYPLASIQLVVPNRFQFGLTAAPFLEVLRQRGLRQSIRITDANNGPMRWHQQEDNGPRLFVGGEADRAITCFLDVRASLLRPDLLQSVEGGRTNSRRRADGGEGGGDRTASEGRSAAECVRTSEFSVIPLDTGWIDLSELDAVRSWGGSWFLEDEDQGYEEPSSAGVLSEENCVHLRDMHGNRIYASAFPYFSARYQCAMRRELHKCGYES